MASQEAGSNRESAGSSCCTLNIPLLFKRLGCGHRQELLQVRVSRFSFWSSKVPLTCGKLQSEGVRSVKGRAQRAR